MPTLSLRSKHASKTALAVVIAYAIALHMDWHKPIWSGGTAARVSQDSTGLSIQKVLNPIAGARGKILKNIASDLEGQTKR